MAQERQHPMKFSDIAATVDVVFDGQRARLIEQLDRAVERASKHLGQRRGSEAQFTLQVKFKGKGEITISVTLDPKEKNPAPLAMTAFVDKYGMLVAEDPSQIDLPLEIVPPVKKEG